MAPVSVSAPPNDTELKFALPEPAAMVMAPATVAVPVPVRVNPMVVDALFRVVTPVPSRTVVPTHEVYVTVRPAMRLVVAPVAGPEILGPDVQPLGA